VRLTGNSDSQLETQSVAGRSATRKSDRTTLRQTVTFPLSNLTTNEVATVFSSQNPRGRDRHRSRHSTTKPVIFVDGEGANIGAPLEWRGKRYQVQNYALLTAVFSTGEYRKIMGSYGTSRLKTRECLQFLLDLPKTHLVVGYGIDYDVQQMLYDVPARYMRQLHKRGFVRWQEFILSYKPHKSFSVSVIPPKGKTISRKSRSRKSVMWWDMAGFFQKRFDKAVEMWEVTDPADIEFLETMKLKRSTFAGIDQEQLEYNKLEGVNGVRIFEKVRAEWTKLQLPVRRFDGAGAVASAMFTKNGVESYLTQRNPIPADIMLRAYIGGRFDFSRQGFIGDATEFDINSAYPNIARNLPCLTCSEWQYTREFVSSPNSLWHVRWDLENPRWAPFPFRDRNGRIRYYSSGEGWYYGAEVERALGLYPNIKILGGYYLLQSCNHRPFAWIEDYYEERQRLKAEHDFGEQVLKLGMNAAYGKLAQSKGHVPKFQCLVWAGMITSGTRAMILEAISHDPASVSVTATDAVISSAKLPLHIDPLQLGAWEAKPLSDVLVIGNGLYCDADGHKNGSRGFDKSKLDWDRLRVAYRESHRPFDFDVPATTFFGYVAADTQSRWDLRCTWEISRKTLRVEIPEWKEERNGWLYPLPEPTGECSYPARIPGESLRLDAPVLDTEIVSSSEEPKETGIWDA